MSTPRIRKVALRGVRGRLYHGGGGFHLGKRSDALEDVLFEAGFTRGDLELGRAGDAIDGLVKCREHALIRGVHADEHGDTEYDSGHGEDHAQEVLARVGAN